MSYEHRNSYGMHNDYKSNSRRNSNSFSDDHSGAKRKKRWPRRKPGNRNDSAVFKEPAVPPKRSPMISPSQSMHRDNPFRKNSPHPYFHLRDMPEFVERPHAGAQWYWDTYFDKCKAWQDKHKLAYYRSRCVALEFENQMLFEQINSLIQENCVFAAERGEVPTMRLPENYDRSGSQSEEGGQTPVKQGKKRTQEADKKKVNEESKKKDEDGPKLPHKRKEELELLYGKHSALIHGLETSVQLNFNRNCDTHKPELWMAVALNPETVIG